MTRKRWLSVWVRCDLDIKAVLGTFKFPCTDFSWKHPSVEFHIPEPVQRQLMISGDLERIYGDPQMLPPSLRSKISQGASAKEVLKARCVHEKDILPTLVASYGSQHCLPPDHLVQKGIFASVRAVDDSFAFVDPCKLVALLGAPAAFPCVFPLPIKKMFLHIGNAISTSHAALANLVVLNVLGQVTDIRRNIEALWNDRISPENTVILVRENHVWIVPVAAFARTCSVVPSRINEPSVLVCTSHFRVRVPKNITLAGFLALAGLDRDQCDQVRGSYQGLNLSLGVLLGSLCDKYFHLTIRDRHLIAMHVCEEPEVVEEPAICTPVIGGQIPNFGSLCP